MSNNILQYESKVWATADLLIGAGIKQSDFPKFMMPFFALIMVESRLLRMVEEIKADFGDDEIEDFIDEVKEQEQGYNEYLLRHNKTIVDICRNDKSFEVDFAAYLKGFDPQTQMLLGVDRSNDEEKFLNISGISGLLRKKKILFATVKAWSEIDLKPFSNSEITTLEEHIKRKWADISAETAGEQYTPDDVIALISEIICSKIEDNGEFLTIYDPTCGGGNMLFGVEDKITERFSRPTKTFGQDWNDALYALAKIESRFRQDSEIEYGNSLTDIKFLDKQFSVAVANPPYGVDWKGYKDDILKDETGRFVDLPSVSDGQLLFMQHLVHQLDIDGLGVVVHNGSSLFSGDAGSGESNIRKWLFDQDIVEALVQLPTDEFFNTNIYTYLWVINKHKPAERKDKVMLINASDMGSPLKKSKGKKRKELAPEARAEIVNTLATFKDNDYAHVFDKWHFYFNKQAIMLTNVDEEGRSYEEQLPVKVDKQTGEEQRAKSKKLKDLIEISQTDEEGTISLKEFTITEYDEAKCKNLNEYYEEEIKPIVSRLDYKEQGLKVITPKATYYYDKDKETLIKEAGGKKEALGCGVISIKATYKKATKTKEASIEIAVELKPDYQKDYEIIEYSPDETTNRKNIDAFVAKYVTKPYRYMDNVVGVEVNFNKVFYKPEKLRPVSTILEGLNELEKELKNLENELGL